MSDQPAVIRSYSIGSITLFRHDGGTDPGLLVDMVDDKGESHKVILPTCGPLHLAASLVEACVHDHEHGQQSYRPPPYLN